MSRKISIISLAIFGWAGMAPSTLASYQFKKTQTVLANDSAVQTLLQAGFKISNNPGDQLYSSSSTIDPILTIEAKPGTNPVIDINDFGVRVGGMNPTLPSITYPGTLFLGEGVTLNNEKNITTITTNCLLGEPLLRCKSRAYSNLFVAEAGSKFISQDVYIAAIPNPSIYDIDHAGIGTLMLHGQAAVGNVYISSPYSLGILTVRGNPGRTAILNADSIYLPQTDNAGAGEINVFNHAEINLTGSLSIGHQFYKNYWYLNDKTPKETMTVIGPSATINVNENTIFGNNIVDEQVTRNLQVPVDVTIEQGGVLNTGSLFVQGFKDKSNPATLNILPPPTNFTEVNVTHHQLILRNDGTITIGDPNHTSGKTGSAELNIQSGGENDATPPIPNVIIEGNSHLNIDQAGAMNVNFDHEGNGTLTSDVLIKDNVTVTLENGGQLNVGTSAHHHAWVTLMGATQTGVTQLKIDPNSKVTINGTLYLPASTMVKLPRHDYIDVAGQLTVRNLYFGQVDEEHPVKSKIFIHYSDNSGSNSLQSGTLRVTSIKNPESGDIICISDEGQIFPPKITSYSGDPSYAEYTCKRPISRTEGNPGKISLPRLSEPFR